MDVSGDAPLRHTFLDPRLYNLNQPQISSLPLPLSARINSDNDRQIIDKWLCEKGKFPLSLYYPPKKPPNEVSINGTKQVMGNCLAIMQKLHNIQKELHKNVETLSSHDWKEKTQEVGALKEELNKFLTPFEDNRLLSNMKSLLNKRLKKRRNQKARRKFRQEQSKIKKEKQVEKHKAIDQWLENKQEEAERLKVEEKMKKDADCVLYEVTKKKSEARKQLSLISALVKLRSVRDSMAVQRGEKLSLEDRKAFGSVTEKLIRMWENALQNYNKEEQCLKIMLAHNAEKDTKAVTRGKQIRIIDEWDNLVFGSKDTSTASNATFWALTSADRDLESFVAIRKSWDTFVNSSGTPIPVGWAVPPVKDNEAWVVYLNNN